MNNQLKNIIISTIFASILCVLSPISIPVGIVPITFASFVIYIIGALFKPIYAFLTVFIYIFIGVLGLPVFSYFQGGFHVLVGPTGGFIIGYLIAVLIISFIININKESKILYPISMLIGTLVVYIIGSIYYMLIMDVSLVASIIICIVPFIIGDIVKIILASTVVIILKDKIKTSF